MKIVRFLQVRPYWLYKLAALLLTLAFALALLYIFLSRNDTIFYPVMLLLTPLSALLFGIAFFAFLAETAVYLTREPRNSIFLHVSLALLLITFVLVSLMIVGPSINPLVHISSVQRGDHVYNLAEEAFGWYAGCCTLHTHILYECDRNGLICRALHKEELMVAQIIFPQGEVHRTDRELVTNTASNTVAILVDGEVVYTHQL